MKDANLVVRFVVIGYNGEEVIRHYPSMPPAIVKAETFNGGKAGREWWDQVKELARRAIRFYRGGFRVNLGKVNQAHRFVVGTSITLTVKSVNNGYNFERFNLLPGKSGAKSIQHTGKSFKIFATDYWNHAIEGAMICEIEFQGPVLDEHHIGE